MGCRRVCVGVLAEIGRLGRWASGSGGSVGSGRIIQQDDDSGSHYDSQQECGKRLPDHFIFFLDFWVSTAEELSWLRDPHHTDTHAYSDSCIYHIIDSCMWQVKNFFHVAFSLLVSVVVFPSHFFLMICLSRIFSDHPWNHFGLPVSGWEFDFSFPLYFFWVSWTFFGSWAFVKLLLFMLTFKLWPRVVWIVTQPLPGCPTKTNI